MDSELLDKLSVALKTLNDRQLQVMTALYRDGRSFREVAAELGCSARTVTRLRDSSVAAMTAAMPGVESLLTTVHEDRTPTMAGGQALRVSWATCGRCLSERVELDDDELCAICGPIEAATTVATMGHACR